MWTFSNGTSLDTVAVGFSQSGRYVGPSPCSGAGEETPFCVLVVIIDLVCIFLPKQIEPGVNYTGQLVFYLYYQVDEVVASDGGNEL